MGVFSLSCLLCLSVSRCFPAKQQGPRPRVVGPSGKDRPGKLTESGRVIQRRIVRCDEGRSRHMPCCVLSCLPNPTISASLLESHDRTTVHEQQRISLEGISPHCLTLFTICLPAQFHPGRLSLFLIQIKIADPQQSQHIHNSPPT